MATNPYTQPNVQLGAANSNLGANTGQSWEQTQALLGGGQDALNKWAQSAMSSAMPGLQAQLQQSQEGAQRRGISTGDLGTSYQGDVLGAFQKNIPGRDRGTGDEPVQYATRDQCGHVQPRGE